jgi:predicted aspartyl protease
VALSCPVRTAAPSPADIAFQHHKFDDAAKLYLDESKKPGPDAERAHNRYIQSLIALDKVDDAAADAKAWVASSPSSAWAHISLGEVQFRQGRIDEIIPSIQAAGSLDRCNMETHILFARFSEATGMYDTARKHLDVAHTFEPNDSVPHNLWVALQPRSVQLAEVTRALDQDSSMPPAEKEFLTDRKTVLEHPSQSCGLSEKVTSTSVPYHAVPHGPLGSVDWTLVVSLNGHERRLEIDTGASGFVLYRGAAAGLNLTSLYETRAGGVGDQGSVKDMVANVKDIKIGGLDFHDCDVDVLEGGDSELEDVDGLIGTDVFSNFLVTLDFPGHKLQLDPLPAIPGEAAITPSLNTEKDSPDRTRHDGYTAPEMQNWTPVLRLGHMLLMPVTINTGLPHFFLVDTGADMTSLSPAAAREIGKVETAGMEIHGISGQVKKVYASGQVMLHFAGLRFPSPSLFAFDTTNLSSDTGVEISGFLGAGVLRRLTVQIDYRDDLVKFNYDPKRLQPCIVGVYMQDCY